MSNPVTPAGWYPDPAGSPRSRWWDGTQWSEHFYDPATGAPVADLTAPAGTKVYNAWIWIAVLLPYITLPLIFTMDFSSMFTGFDPSDPNSTTTAQMSLLMSPAYLLLSLGGFVISGVVIFSAYRDWKWLVAAGVPKPFHWAWSFINLAGYPVYAIGRAVITKRRTGHGSAVLWVTIGMLVLSFVVIIVWVGALITSMMQQFSTLY